MPPILPHSMSPTPHPTPSTSSPLRMCSHSYLRLDHKSAERCYSVIKNDNTLGWRARITCINTDTLLALEHHTKKTHTHIQYSFTLVHRTCMPSSCILPHTHTHTPYTYRIRDESQYFCIYSLQITIVRIHKRPKRKIVRDGIDIVRNAMWKLSGNLVENIAIVYLKIALLCIKLRSQRDCHTDAIQEKRRTKIPHQFFESNFSAHSI